MIQPTTLIPTGSGSDALPYEGKKVDYCLFIQPSEEEAESIKNLLVSLDESEQSSINQTQAYYCRNRPQFASVELKQPLASHDPLLQLAIWNSALFSRLERLLDLEGSSAPFLPIPSITVVGHDWKVCYSYIDQDGRTRVNTIFLDSNFRFSS